MTKGLPLKQEAHDFSRGRFTLKYVIVYLLTASFFLLLLTNALALPTDGNYTLISFTTIASGETQTKGETYTADISIGEPAVKSGLADYNSSAGIGLLGEPIQKLSFPEEIAEEVNKIFMIFMPQQEGDLTFIPLLMIMTAVTIIGLALYYKKKGKGEKAE